MSLSITNLTSGHNEGSPISGGTTASVTPAANSLLILAVGGFDGTGIQDFTVASVSGFGATWTQQKLATAGSSPKGDVEAWTAVMGSSPGTGAITLTLSGSVNAGIAWVVDQAAGQDPVTPVVTGNIVTGRNSSAASSVTYGSAASASNLFWFMSACLLGPTQTTTQTPAETPAWTALATVQSDTTTLNGVSTATQVSPDTSHLSASATLTTAHSWGTIGLEIAAATTPPPPPVTYLYSMRMFP